MPKDLGVVASGTDIATVAYVQSLAALKSGTVTLVIVDEYQRFIITDSSVSATSKIIGNLVRGTIAEVDDPGWHYTFNIVNRRTGFFDLTVKATIWGEDPVDELGILGAPNETLTFYYLLQ